jgi:RNA polymerase subunit RPABC4/transcription elongation factor Spt4
MPTTPQRARKLLRGGVAEKRWNKLGQFYLQMLRPVGNKKQPVCLAIDTGNKWDGMAVVTKKQVLTTAELVLPSGIAKKLEVRRMMRRVRRYRNTPRRAKRSNNRRRPEGWLAPSQKAKVDFRTKVVDELCKIYPIDRFAVEDVRFDHYRKRWGKYFSTVEIGKAKFYEHLRKLGDLRLYSGVETAEWRGRLGLPKNPRKSALGWDAHASDATAIGCAEMGCADPTPPEFWVWKRFQYARRQLHKFEPAKGGIRRREGGSWSIPPFKKGDVVLWRGRLARVGGHMGNRISLHAFTLKNKRITQRAKPEDCTRLFNQRIFYERKIPQFLPALADGASLGEWR